MTLFVNKSESSKFFTVQKRNFIHWNREKCNAFDQPFNYSKLKYTSTFVISSFNEVIQIIEKYRITNV